VRHRTAAPKRLRCGLAGDCRRKETVSSQLLAQLARSPSGTGRASFQPHGPADKHLNQLGTTTSQTRPRKPVNLTTTRHKLVDPITGIPSLTGSYALSSVACRSPQSKQIKT
jgi:hypothetical protein